MLDARTRPHRCARSFKSHDFDDKACKERESSGLSQHIHATVGMNPQRWYFVTAVRLRMAAPPGVLVVALSNETRATHHRCTRRRVQWDNV